MILSGLTSVEILGLAIAQEVEAYKRYKLLANKVNNLLVKQKFVSLAHEEKSHREILYKLLQSYTQETKPALPRKAPRLNREIEANRPIHEIIEIAILKEREAQDFYREASKVAKDPTGKRLLDYLATFEEGHERMLQNELDALTKYPQWFETEGADIMLVGP